MHVGEAADVVKSQSKLENDNVDRITKSHAESAGETAAYRTKAR